MGTSGLHYWCGKGILVIYFSLLIIFLFKYFKESEHMNVYFILKITGKTNFEEALNKYSEEDWEPIWATFKRGTDQNVNPTYEIILEKEKPQ